MRLLVPRSTDVFDDFDHIFNSFLQPSRHLADSFTPACDVSETKDHYMMSFDMPGLKKDEIKIEVQGHQLMISGERQREYKDETHHRHERSYGRFERSFTLPESVNADQIEAHYEDGVLNLALPKAEISKGRTIQVKSGEGGFFNKLVGGKKEDSKSLKDVKVN